MAWHPTMRRQTQCVYNVKALKDIIKVSKIEFTAEDLKSSKISTSRCIMNWFKLETHCGFKKYNSDWIQVVYIHNFTTGERGEWNRMIPVRLMIEYA